MSPRKSGAASAPSSTPEALDAASSVDPTTLVGYHRNPRKGSVDAIVASLEAHGQYKPLVVNRGTKTGRPNEVLAGNHLLAAGLKLQLPTMLVHWLDVDDDEATRIVLVDNRSSDLGGYDEKLLAEVLVDLDDLMGTGYSEADLRRLLNGFEPGDGEGLTDPDAVPGVTKDTITALGDVWLLGPHRLVCGDSREVDPLAAAAGGTGVEVMWTDPPARNPKEPDEYEQMLYDVWTIASTVLRPGAACYVAHDDADRLPLTLSLENAGCTVRQTLIWVRNAMIIGKGDYQTQHSPVLEVEAAGLSDVEADHEPIAYAFTPGGEGRLGRGGARWYSQKRRSTVFEIDTPAASKRHKSIKPVELIVEQLRNSVARGERVLDPFAGTGTTLIACHQLGALARLVEIDPRLCDVIVRRYQEHTGVVPILESTGQQVSFLRTPGDQ